MRKEWRMRWSPFWWDFTPPLLSNCVHLQVCLSFILAAGSKTLPQLGNERAVSYSLATTLNGPRSRTYQLSPLFNGENLSVLRAWEVSAVIYKNKTDAKRGIVLFSEPPNMSGLPLIYWTLFVVGKDFWGTFKGFHTIMQQIKFESPSKVQIDVYWTGVWKCSATQLLTNANMLTMWHLQVTTIAKNQLLCDCW